MEIIETDSFTSGAYTTAFLGDVSLDALGGRA
jgi:hypothetical protein